MAKDQITKEKSMSDLMSEYQNIYDVCGCKKEDFEKILESRRKKKAQESKKKENKNSTKILNTFLKFKIKKDKKK
jgi:hypothetical protein